MKKAYQLMKAEILAVCTNDILTESKGPKLCDDAGYGEVIGWTEISNQKI